MGFIDTQFFSIRLFILSFLLFIPSLSSALPIKVGSTDFPPFYVINDDGSASGIYVDIMEKTLEHAELKYTIDTFPTKRLYRNLGTGKTDVFIGLEGSPEYNDHVLYSKMAVSQLQMRVYAIDNTPLPSSKEDFNGHRIITMRGFGYCGLVKYFEDPTNHIEVTSTSKHRSSFLMLKNKRADYVINYKQPSETALEELEIEGLKYTNLKNAEVYFIVSKKTPNAQQVLTK
jgi:polar amino acid transport system substrate-binding protein